MRLFPFFQSGEPGAVSKESDTAHTVDRSGVRSMSLTSPSKSWKSQNPKRFFAPVALAKNLRHKKSIP